MKKNVKSIWGEAIASWVASSLSFLFYRATVVDDANVQRAILSA
ncbi:MAG TPA: hypothetical protein VGE79_16160 [Niastella sp.]